jgi:hypothetical protein
MEERKIEAKAGECIGEELLKRPGSDILILFHRATVVKGEPQLTEHSEILWAKPEELDSLEFTPPDKAMARKLLEPGPR